MEKKLKETIRSFAVVAGFVAVITLAVTLTLCSTLAPHDDVRFWGDGSSLYSLSEGWTVKDGKASYSTSLPINNSLEISSDVISISNALPKEHYGDFILFRTSLQAIEVFVGGEKIYEYGHFEKAFGHNNGSVWNFIQLPKNCEGKSIDISITNPYESRKGTINAVYIGSSREIMGYLINSYGFALLCIVITFFTGVALLMYFLFLRISGIKANVRMLWVALLAVFSSLWQFTECKLTQMLVGNMAGFSTANFLFLIIMIIPGLMYIDDAENREYHRGFVLFEIAFEANAFVQIVLQTFEIFDFYEMLIATHILLVIACAFIVMTVVICFVENKTRTLGVMLGSVVILVASTLFETFYCDITGYVNGKLLTVAVLIAILSSGIESVRTAFNTIQESRRAVEENAQKSTFLANISHEIRTPMNAICAMSELLIDSKDISAGDKDFAKTIHSSAVHLLDIINDVLDYSKITADKYDIVNERYNLSQLVTDVKEIIAVRAAEKKIDFTIVINPGIPYELIGDQIRIRQILINLLNNAVKFTESGEVKLIVDFETKDDGGIFLVMRVCDTGVGIEEKEFEDLFEAFTQVDKARTHAVEGTGLGLAISRTIARLMGGDIEVKSTVGVGSVFTARVSQGVASAKTYSSDMDDYFKNEIARSVIIVDDEHGSMDSIEADMKNSGVNIRVFREEDIDISLERQPRSVVVFRAKEHPYLLSEEFKGQHPYTRLVGVADCLEMVDANPDVEILRLPICVIDFTTLIKPPVKEAALVEFEAPYAKVLVVDDNTINLRVMKELLSRYRINPTLCSTGAQAVEAAKVKNFDLIFMDHMMPGMDGIEATGIIREIPQKGKQVSIVALSANAVKGAEKMYKENGFDGYLAKPVSINSVGKTLKKYLPGLLIRELHD